MCKRGIMAAGRDAEREMEGVCRHGSQNRYGGARNLMLQLMKKTFFSTLLLAAVTFSAQAAPLINEPFTYADGVLTAVSGGLWANYSGPANQLDVLGARAHLTHLDDEDVQRAIPPFTSGTIYYSFVVNVSTPPPTTNVGNFIVFLKDQTTPTPNLRAKVFVTPIGAGAGRYRVGVANAASTISATSSAIIPTDLVPGTSYLLVVCYTQPATGGIPQTTLWINPCSPNDTANRTNALDQTFFVTPNAIALSQSLGSIGVLDIDSLKVATTFSEVGDTTPPVITCPASFTPGSVIRDGSRRPRAGRNGRGNAWCKAGPRRAHNPPRPRRATPARTTR